jgi:hypothetical protein
MLAGIVFTEELTQALIEFTHRFIGADEDVVILYRAPEPLDHDVIQCAAFAIQTDAYIMALQNPGKGVGGILASLGRC